MESYLDVHEIRLAEDLLRGLVGLVVMDDHAQEFPPAHHPLCLQRGVDPLSDCPT